MTRTKSVFEETGDRAPPILELYGLGLSIEDIALLGVKCNFGPTFIKRTIAAMVRRAGGAKAFPNRPKKRDAFAAVLRRYAEIVKLEYDTAVARRVNTTARDDVPTGLLRAVLAVLLREEEILATMRGMEYLRARLVVPYILPGSEGPARFLATVYNNPWICAETDAVHASDAECIATWHAYLSWIRCESSCGRPIPKTCAELYRSFANGVNARCRGDIMPIFDPDQLTCVLEPILAELTPEERETIELRFGLSNHEAPATVRAIATSAHTSPEHIRRIIRRAFRKIRASQWSAVLGTFTVPLGMTHGRVTCGDFVVWSTVEETSHPNPA